MVSSILISWVWHWSFDLSRGVMIPALDPDLESGFQPFGDYGSPLDSFLHSDRNTIVLFVFVRGETRLTSFFGGSGDRCSWWSQDRGIRCITLTKVITYGQWLLDLLVYSSVAVPLQPFAIATVVCKWLLRNSYAIYCTQADRVIIAYGWLCSLITFLI